jgi:hypothetical protein
MTKDKDGLHERLEQAGRPDEDHQSQERNAGLAIAVLAAVVVLLLVAMVLGATDALRP